MRWWRVRVLHRRVVAQPGFHLLGLENPPDWVNVGVGEDVTILELAILVANWIAKGLVKVSHAILWYLVAWQVGWSAPANLG